MKILISGATGLIGGALRRHLVAKGHAVSRLVRRAPQRTAAFGSSGSEPPEQVPWQPGEPSAPGLLAGFDVVVHLAGRSLAGRWTPQLKREITASRLEGTATVAEAVARSFAACGRPSVLVSASAIGYYGNRGDEWLTEESDAGSGFLADLCRRWEASTEAAAAAGVRVILPRFGIVLSRDGGALAKMLPLFSAGLGGRLGSGRQFWSWITLADTVAAIDFAIADLQLSGPLNLTVPNPATNAEFTAALAGALKRPAWFPAPAFALRLVMGEMADAALLASQRVRPARLEARGFRWQHVELGSALRAVLSPPE